MADWLDWGETAFGSDVFSGDTVNWSDWTDGGGWSDVIGDLFTGDDSGSFWGGLIKSFTGGGNGGSGSGTNMWASLLGGLGGAAQGYLSGKDLKESIEAQGKESRKSSLFEAELADYYSQKNKVRKRSALDTYGQFSLAPRINSAAIDLPNKPSV